MWRRNRRVPTVTLKVARSAPPAEPTYGTTSNPIYAPCKHLQSPNHIVRVLPLRFGTSSLPDDAPIQSANANISCTGDAWLRVHETGAATGSNFLPLDIVYDNDYCRTP